MCPVLSVSLEAEGDRILLPEEGVRWHWLLGGEVKSTYSGVVSPWLTVCLEGVGSRIRFPKREVRWLWLLCGGDMVKSI